IMIHSYENPVTASYVQGFFPCLQDPGPAERRNQTCERREQEQNQQQAASSKQCGLGKQGDLVPSSGLAFVGSVYSPPPNTSLLIFITTGDMISTATGSSKPWDALLEIRKIKLGEEVTGTLSMFPSSIKIHFVDQRKVWFNLTKDAVLIYTHSCGGVSTGMLAIKERSRPPWLPAKCGIAVRRSTCPCINAGQGNPVLGIASQELAKVFETDPDTIVRNLT
ncbi:hypothetical protein STEG23_007918, partial [Scotinomys teguina]